jgi:hypothetical protein
MSAGTTPGPNGKHSPSIHHRSAGLTLHMCHSAHCYVVDGTNRESLCNCIFFFKDPTTVTGSGLETALRGDLVTLRTENGVADAVPLLASGP